MIIIIYNKKVGSTSKASASGLLVTANLKHGVNSIRAQSFTRSQRWSRGQNLLIKTQKLVRNPKLKNTLLTALYQNASHLWKMRSQQIAEMKLKKAAITGEERRNVITTISRSSVKCDGRRKKTVTAIVESLKTTFRFSLRENVSWKFSEKLEGPIFIWTIIAKVLFTYLWFKFHGQLLWIPWKILPNYFNKAFVSLFSINCIWFKSNMFILKEEFQANL